MEGQSAYQILFQQMDSPLIILDANDKISDLNLSAQKLFNVNIEKAKGLRFVHMMKTTFDYDVLLDAISDKPIPLQANDKTHYYRLDLKPLPDNAGHIIIFDEVTELTELQNDYSEFAHTLGHDLKSPLGVAIGYSNILQSDFEAGTETRFFIDEIFDTSMRIMNICNELVLLADIRFAEDTEMMPINLQVVLNTVLRRFSTEIATRTITINVPDNLPLILGNIPWVEEALVDFLAFAFVNNPSSTTVTIDISACKDDFIRFVIRHDGTDRLATHVETVFPDTVDLRNIRAEGQGLGLSIAKLLVEKMGGQVGITDEQSIYCVLPASID